MDAIYLIACVFIFFAVAIMWILLAKVFSKKIWVWYFVVIAAWAIGEIIPYAVWKIIDCTPPVKNVDAVIVKGFLSSEKGSPDWIRQQFKRGFDYVEIKDPASTANMFIKYQNLDGSNYSVLHESSRSSEIEERRWTEYVPGKLLKAHWELWNLEGSLLGRAVDVAYYGSWLAQEWASINYPHRGALGQCSTIYSFRNEILLPDVIKRNRNVSQ